jgi:hypothetical protein
VSIWTEAKYPGDAVRIQQLHRAGEIGDIRIQFIRDGLVKVCSFLPGEEECSPGDTPKVWPEKSEYAMSSFAADEQFDKYVGEAYADGWQNYDRETYRG